MGSRYGFYLSIDIVAEKNGEFNAVEVKTEITPRDLGQLWSYMLQFKKSHPQSKYYLGTDCLNYWSLKIGEIGEILKSFMRNEELGVIFVNPKRYWVFNDYESFLTAEDTEPLCLRCEYCERVSLSPNSVRLLRQFISKLRDPMYDEGAVCSLEDIVQCRQSLLKIKEEIGMEEFEKNIGIRVRDFPIQKE